jgi:hypothetical protein
MKGSAGAAIGAGDARDALRSPSKERQIKKSTDKRSMEKHKGSVPFTILIITTNLVIVILVAIVMAVIVITVVVLGDKINRFENLDGLCRLDGLSETTAATDAVLAFSEISHLV